MARPVSSSGLIAGPADTCAPPEPLRAAGRRHTPTLPTGAGGPRERAAGRVLPAVSGQAVVLESDGLLRLHAAAAAQALGFRVGDDADDAPAEALTADPWRPAVCFVGLDRDDACPRLRRRESAAPLRVPPGTLLAGYCGGAPALAAAHRLHGCCDLVLRLEASGGQARFAYLPPADDLTAAGLSAREADVLLLILAGATTATVARRLVVAPATARAHCRAVLRKLEAADRRALRARLLGRPLSAGETPPLSPGA